MINREPQPPPASKSSTKAPAVSPDPAAIDGWTRISPPPKTRISEAFAAPDASWRKINAALAAVACAGLLLAMGLYAAKRTDAVRESEAIRQKAEPSRSELREQSGAKARAEFEKKRADAQAELARRGREEAERRGAKGSSGEDRSGTGRQ